MSSSAPDLIDHRRQSGWIEPQNAWVSCSCGWYRMGFQTRRSAERKWHEHADFVRHATDPA